MAYSGAYGRRQPPPPEQRPIERPGQHRPPQREDKLAGAVGSLMKKLESVSAGMEQDDLLMALILYLMYRESGDKDLLIMLGAMLLT